MEYGRRIVMTLVGAAVMLAYLLAGFVAFSALRHLLTTSVGPFAVFTGVVTVVVVLAVVNHYVGSSRVLAGLGATELPHDRVPLLYAVTDQLADQMQLRPPRLLVADLEAPNAFALGGAKAGSVVIDRSLFDLLTVREMRALLAHELAHLESNDSVVQTVSAVVARTMVGVLLVPLLPVVLVITGFARGTAWLDGRPDQWTETPAGRLRVGFASLVTVFLFGFTLVARSYARRRELAADDRAADVTGDPLALAGALRKLHQANDPRWGLFSTLYVAPREDDLTRLLSTHPPVEERIERLVEQVDEPPASQWYRVKIE